MDANYGELSIDIHWPNITVTFYGDGTTITSNGASIERFIDGNLGDALLPEAYKDAPDVAFSVVGVTFIDFGISSTTGSQVNGGAIQMRGFYSIAIINCNFYRNRGYYGGAIQVDLTDRVLIQGCKFIGNFGGFLAGALYISNNNGMLSVRDPLVAAVYVADNYFANNTALYGGGAVSVGFYNFVFFENNLFFENTAIYGGGVFMSYLSIINFEGCHFKWNSADYGGGLIVAFELFFVKVSGCIFEENVGTFGGGLMISKFMNDVIVDGCVFLRNQGLF